MINAIAIDDEPQALEIIKHYVGKIDQITLVGAFTNPLEALDVVKYKPIDLLFLDIQMPDITGMEFLGLLPKPIPTILVTAYESYALESYNYLCIDYLLKPVNFSRFVASIEKYRSLHKPLKNNTGVISLENKISFNTGRETVFLSPAEILFVEADGNYSRINCSDKRLLITESLKDLAERLPDTFYRIHRSFIVNSQAIDSIESTQIHIASHHLPIGRKFRSGFISFLGT